MIEIVKIIASAILIFIVSELSKRSGKVGGLVLSLPLTSLIAMSWLWFETQDRTKVASLSTETLIFIIPSLTFFIILPILLNRSFDFYLAMILSIFFTMGAYAIFFKVRG